MGKDVHAALLDGYDDYIKWLCWPKNLPTIDEVESDCRVHNAEFILRTCIRYIIFDKQTNQVIGRCVFPPAQAKWNIPQFGISYFIRKTQRSKGFASEASLAMAYVAFKILQAKKVEIHCDSTNLDSIKIPLNLNFKLEYSQKGSWPSQNKELATVNTYSIFSVDVLPKLGINFSET